MSYGSNFTTQKKGIVSPKPVLFFRATATGDITTLGIIGEDGFPRPTEKTTEAVLSAYHGSDFAIAHIQKEGEKLAEVTFVNYNKHGLVTCFPHLITAEANNLTSATDPLKGNLRYRSNAGVAPQGILIVKTAYIDIQGNDIKLTDKTDPNNLDLMYPVASAVNITGMEYKGSEGVMPVVTFAFYPDENDEYEYEGSGIDETDMTYTPPAV